MGTATSGWTIWRRCSRSMGVCVRRALRRPFVSAWLGDSQRWGWGQRSRRHAERDAYLPCGPYNRGRWFLHYPGFPASRYFQPERIHIWLEAHRHAGREGMRSCQGVGSAVVGSGGAGRRRIARTDESTDFADFAEHRNQRTGIVGAAMPLRGGVRARGLLGRLAVRVELKRTRGTDTTSDGRVRRKARRQEDTGSHRASHGAAELGQPAAGCVERGRWRGERASVAATGKCENENLTRARTCSRRAVSMAPELPARATGGGRSAAIHLSNINNARELPRRAQRDAEVAWSERFAAGQV